MWGWRDLSAPPLGKIWDVTTAAGGEKVIKALSPAYNTSNSSLLPRPRKSNVPSGSCWFCSKIPLLQRSAAFHGCYIRLCFAYPSRKLGKPTQTPEELELPLASPGLASPSWQEPRCLLRCCIYQPLIDIPNFPLTIPSWNTSPASSTQPDLKFSSTSIFSRSGRAIKPFLHCRSKYYNGKEHRREKIKQ